MELWFGGAWHPILRYDASHDVADRDVYETPSRKHKERINLSLSQALTLADRDIDRNWGWYVEAFKDEEQGMTWFEELNAEVGAEFDRYAVEHPIFAAKIPRGAQVVLQLPDNPRFNTWLRRLASKQHQPGQPVVVVQIGKLLPARSRIRAPKLRIEAA